ncbi:MAG: ECF transporter S component [Theionarchaea archaeon]|nr:ECF transporter S component [Theionarchaea archaeon]MBU7038833.1 ECF transporter S component [Theionarchaea archaeon]
MTETPKKMLEPRQLALSAIFAAVVCAATLVIRIPVPATSGYINLGDSMIFVSALLFGSRIGGVAGGVGSALADILGGFGSWAPFTLIIKGTEGFITGKLAKSGKIPASIIAVIVGGCIMVAGYFVVEAYLYGIPAAIAELPGNLFQAGSGLLIAIPLSKAVQKAMPERFL